MGTITKEEYAEFLRVIKLIYPPLPCCAYIRNELVTIIHLEETYEYCFVEYIKNGQIWMDACFHGKYYSLDSLSPPSTKQPTTPFSIDFIKDLPPLPFHLPKTYFRVPCANDWVDQGMVENGFVYIMIQN